MLVYRLMRGFLRLLVGIFFRQIEVVGLEHVPADGPVIFAGNHPNSLLDPVMIVTTCGRTVSFAAKDVLFRSPVLRLFLNALGCVPIRRKHDKDGAEAAAPAAPPPTAAPGTPEAEPVDNSQAFEALFDILAQGRTMGIFPEGISHDEAQLQRLKTGAARIVLGMAERHPGVVVKIVPCGLTYVRRKHFRGRVLVQFGEPITLTAADLELHARDPRASARELTARIEGGIKGLTINASDWDTLRVLDGVRRLYQPPQISLHERVELSRRFAEVYPSVATQPDVVAIVDRVRAYLDRLAGLGISDRDLSRELWPIEVVARLAKNLVYLGIWMPLALPGLILHAPLGYFIGWVGQRFSPRTDVVATTKFMLGMFLVALSYAAVVGAAAWKLGWPTAAAIGAFLPLSGLATVKMLERTASLSRLLQSGLRYTTMKREIAALRSERQALETLIVSAVDRHRPSTMAPLFSRGAAPAHDDLP
jgi:1-acyl-sn-glycerol-3-phosphate acyltransferase